MTRTVLVTGASTGIGAATALHLAAHGWCVLAGVRRAADGEALRSAAAAGADLRPTFLDVADAASIAACSGVVEAAVGAGGLAGLVDNAGIGVAGPLELVPVEALRRQLEVNVVGQVAVIQALLPLLRRGRGRIVMIGSIGGRLAQPFVGPYCASKHALEAIADALRMELRPWGVAVSLLEPGSVRTPIWEKSVASHREALAGVPAERLQLYSRVLERFPEVARQQARSGVSAEKVATVVARALESPRPRPRYLIGRQTRAMALAAHLPDRLRDAAMLRIGGLPRSEADTLPR